MELKAAIEAMKYFKEPTIDLTCCCRKDLDTKVKIILFLFFLIFTLLRVFIGDFAVQDEDLNVEKS